MDHDLINYEVDGHNILVDTYKHKFGDPYRDRYFKFIQNPVNMKKFRHHTQTQDKTLKMVSDGTTVMISRRFG